MIPRQAILDYEKTCSAVQPVWLSEDTRVFYGSQDRTYRSAMFDCRALRFEPLGPSAVLELRIASAMKGIETETPGKLDGKKVPVIGKPFRGIFDIWRRPIFTDMAVVGLDNGKFYLLPKSSVLHNVTQKTDIVDGGFPIDDSKIAEGIEYQTKNFELDRCFTLDEFSKTPTRELWRKLAGDNEKVLNKYSFYGFAFARQKAFCCYNANEPAYNDPFFLNEGLKGLMSLRIPKDKKHIARPVVLSGIPDGLRASWYHVAHCSYWNPLIGRATI